MGEEKQEQPQLQPKQRLVAFVCNSDGSINVHLQGVEWEEARRIISHGRIKFENEYEIFLRRTIK